MCRGDIEIRVWRRVSQGQLVDTPLNVAKHAKKGQCRGGGCDYAAADRGYSLAMFEYLKEH